MDTDIEMYLRGYEYTPQTSYIPAFKNELQKQEFFIGMADKFHNRPYRYNNQPINNVSQENEVER